MSLGTKSTWMELFTINGTDDKPYMTRIYVINNKWFGIKIHFWHRPDADREFHDHPWDFLTLVIKGQYAEQRPHDGVSFRDAGRWAFRKATDLHKVVGVAPGTVSIVINGRKKNDWGFKSRTDGRMIPLDDFMAGER